MTEPRCGCGNPVRDATLCTACGLRLDNALDQITDHHGLGWDLDIALTRQARITRTGGRPTPDEDRDEQRQMPGTLRPTPAPYDQRAADAARTLRAALHTWAQIAAHETGVHSPTNRRGIGPVCRRCPHPSCLRIPAIPTPPATITGLAAWLRPRVGWLRHHPHAQRALDDILDTVNTARAAVDRPAERLYAGPCDQCRNDLYARAGARIVECVDCDLVYEVEARRAWLLRSAEDVLASATEIARAITRFGQPVTPDAIRGYVHRGQLLAHGHRMIGKREIPTYRLGDVLDVLAQQAARVGA